MRMGIVPKFNTTTKAIVVTVLLVTIISSSIGIISYHNSSKALINSIILSLERRTEENADLVYRVLEVFKANIEGIAFRSEIQSMDWDKQKPVLMSETKRLGISRFQVVDMAGMANSTNGLEFSISDREHFIMALQGETVITDPMISRVDGSSIIIVCATPIKNTEGKIIGVLTAALDPQFLFNIIKNRKVGETGYGFMLNNKGIIIAHPKEEIILTEAASVWDKEKQKDFKELAQVEKEMMEGRTGFGYYKYYGQEKCMSYAPIPGSTWSIGLTVPTSEVFYELNSLRDKFIFVTIIVIIIGIALSVLILTYVIELKRTEVLRKDIETSNKLMKESEELDRLRTQFFANISHELRTPLNVISGTIQLCELHVKSDPGLKGVERHLKVLKQNSQRLLRLINNLIDSTRIDAGSLEVHLKNQNIVAVVEDIVLSIVDYAKMKGIDLVFDTSVEELVTAIDVEKFERVLLNLLSNAIKFTEAGGSVLVIVIKEKDKVIVTVKDTGIGIPQDRQGIIFERFIQVDQSLSRSYEGSGIGLSLVKSLVEMHRGQITVHSEVGKGSEFIIELPILVLRGKEREYEDTNRMRSYNVSAQKIKEEFSSIYMDSL